MALPPIATNVWDSPHASTHNRIICFVDVLGFTSRVAGKDQYDLHRVMDAVIKFPRTVAFGPMYDDTKYPGGNKFHRARCTSFSDCFVMTFPFGALDTLNPGNKTWSLDAIGETFGRLFYTVFEIGCLLRGAIIIGQMWHDENFVFGPGLIEAYDLERLVAKQPRIILSEAAANHFGDHPLLYKEQGQPTCFNFVKAWHSRTNTEIGQVLPYLQGDSCSHRRAAPPDAKEKWDWFSARLKSYLEA